MHQKIENTGLLDVSTDLSTSRIRRVMTVDIDRGKVRAA
jgi:hypothetical protein